MARLVLKPCKRKAPKVGSEWERELTEITLEMFFLRAKATESHDLRLSMLLNR